MDIKKFKKERSKRMAKEALVYYKQNGSLRKTGKIMGVSYEKVRRLLLLLEDKNK